MTSESRILPGTLNETSGGVSPSAFTPGPYTGEYGAIIHEEYIGHFFTVQPVKLAPEVADALNKARVFPELLEACLGAAAALDALLAFCEANHSTEFPDYDAVHDAARAAIAKALGAPAADTSDRQPQIPGRTGNPHDQ